MEDAASVCFQLLSETHFPIIRIDQNHLFFHLNLRRFDRHARRFIRQMIPPNTIFGCLRR